MQWNPYIALNGRCKEAFEFYATCLGGKLTAMIGYKDTPAGEHMPPDTGDRIMHARLVAGDQILMGCDAHPAMPYEGIRGNDIAVQVKSPEEAERLFAALADGGSVTMPIGETFWAGRFGLLTDKFGVGWMINWEKVAPA